MHEIKKKCTSKDPHSGLECLFLEGHDGLHSAQQAEWLDGPRCRAVHPMLQVQCEMPPHSGTHTWRSYAWTHSWEDQEQEKRSDTTAKELRKVCTELQRLTASLELSALTAIMVPGLLPRWEARIGQDFGRHVITDPYLFALSEARILARRLLEPEDLEIESTIRMLWGHARGHTEETTPDAARSDAAAEGPRTTATATQRPVATAEGPRVPSVSTRGQ